MCPARSEKLIYQSDFTSASKHWEEWKSETSRSFRRDEYFHLCAKNTAAIRCVGIPVTDCKVSVDAQFTDNNYEGALYAILFRVTKKDGMWDKMYSFNVTFKGGCGLFMHDTDKWIELVGYKKHDFINREILINSLAVEMVGEDITAWVNGAVAVRARDKRLTRGDLGLMVSSQKEYYEARFRNFRLYSIERAEEEVIMPAPPSTPPRRPTHEVFIEKIVTASSASSRPRVAEPASPSQRPSELRTYLGGIIDESGMTGLTTELREEMIEELSRRLNVFIISEVIDHMPARYVKAFTRLHEENRPQAEINRFIEEHVPNARQVFGEIFKKFRQQHGGKGGR